MCRQWRVSGPEQLRAFHVFADMKTHLIWSKAIKKLGYVRHDTILSRTAATLPREVVIAF